MLRAFHRWPGIFALVLITILALSGAALSVFPAVERLSAPQAEAGLNVAVLTARIQAAYPGVEQIRRSPTGKIIAYWFDQGTPGSAMIDPATGKGVASADPNQIERWLTNLHRSLFLDDAGRISMAVGAGGMLVLAISGVMLVLRRVGGWRRWFTRLRGPLSGRLHVEIARIAVAGLLLSSATALWMAASTFDLLPVFSPPPVAPAEVSGLTGAKVETIDLLLRTRVSELRELAFPYPDDATDVFTVKTDQGTGYVDQGTGAQLAWIDLTIWEHVSETLYMLHTGQGAAALGLLLGVMALGVPIMGVTGIIMWVAGRRARPGIKGNFAAARAETIILVGSEGGSTWGFAATLHQALTDAGQTVHAAPMSDFAPAKYAKARRYLILAATYGVGNAPASAAGFLDHLRALPSAPHAPIAILGFGDRNFSAYCAFAEAVVNEAEAKGWVTLLPFDTIDRQSPQEFARWGRALGQAMGFELELVHQPVLPAAQQLTLISRRDFGTELQAPTAILRFAMPKVSIWRALFGYGISRFEAGDLLGILPKGSAVPRFYSLASGSRDGFVEIVVKQQAGGLCSGQLVALEPGDTVSGFLRRNPDFHAGRKASPLILIGAGTGIGPLAGFVRANARHRPVHLFFGMRHADSDFLYGQELTDWQANGRLTRLVTAVSRGAKPHHVQDALRGDATHLAQLIARGAKVMVCGGRNMAAGVAEALSEILAPAGLTTAELKAAGRYVEDVY